ncbi:hypothetical protein GUJ93_ZPchr0006g43183 [Zizania palustris]|uniref:Phytocyanin domain-containing protein n=1 Tax=Zizania palustris TaxID=103762 RepID=A0A8J5SSL9_ZIZPA|nr:hypothetical protein GUJ93_ZPchr0006g43183 [Zizania palustris]
MASAGASCLAMVALLLVACVPAAAATSYTVGDSSGWTTGIDYTRWIGCKSFKVGDSLGKGACMGMAMNFLCCLTRSRLHEFGGLTCSVQVRERGAHGDRGERGGLPGVRGGQRAWLRQQWLDHRRPQDGRQTLLHLQHPRPLRRRHEARGGRLRLVRLHPVVADADHAVSVNPDPVHAVSVDPDPDPDNAVSVNPDPNHAVSVDPDPDTDHAVYDADVSVVYWRCHPGNPGDAEHHAIHSVQIWRRRSRNGGIGNLRLGLVCDTRTARGVVE